MLASLPGCRLTIEELRGIERVGGTYTLPTTSRRMRPRGRMEIVGGSAVVRVGRNWCRGATPVLKVLRGLA